MKIVRFYISCCLTLLFQLAVAQQQSELWAPKDYVFEWTKANGDTYAVKVENTLKTAVKRKILDRISMQVLLKATLSSKAFETFTPEYFLFYKSGKLLLVRLNFSFLDLTDKKQEDEVLYRFDHYGNVFDF